MKNSIEKDTEIVENLLSNAHVDYEEYYKQIEIGDISFNAIKNLLSDYKRVLKEVKRYKNMYEAEHQIHLVRNEQLARKQQLVIKCNELENENKELKEEIKSWKKYSAEQEENIIEKNNIICNLEFQREKQKKEIEEKDKIINAMAEYIANLDIDEDICKHIKCSEVDKEREECIECVINYFKNK